MRPSRRLAFVPFATLAAIALFFSPFCTRCSGQDLRDLIIHAAGAVEFRAPQRWRATEAPFEREVRLLLTPPQVADPRLPLNDGIWLVYHVSPVANSPVRQSLEDFAERRLQRDSRTTPTSRFSSFQVSGYPAIEQSIVLSPPANGQPEMLQGACVFVRTPWGVCEWGAVAPPGDYAKRRETLFLILSELNLLPPNQNMGEARPHVIAAEEILGVWKAYRSRLRLFGDGTVEVLADPRRPLVLDGQNNKQQNQSPTLIAGRFRAEADLIMIEWDDGSKLNLRWRRSNGKLLITDHEGRTSLLRPIFE